MMPTQEIQVDEALWALAMVQQGVVGRWFVADGERVAEGVCIAQVSIEGAAHDILAPARGRLTIVSAANTLIEPGSLLARLDTTDADVSMISARA